MTNQSPAGGDVTVSKLLRAMATGTIYKDVGHDIILNKAADLIDAYLAKLTSTKAEPSRVAGVRVLAHRQLRSARDDGFLDLSPLAEYIEALESNITAIEADRDRMREALEDAEAVLISGCRMSPDARIIGVIKAALSPPPTSQSEGEG